MFKQTLLAVLCVSSTSHAFEFDEHAEASRLALKSMEARDDTAEAEEAMQAAIALLSSDTGPGLFCMAGLTTTGRCLHLGDISGIAGDLSSSPGGMFFSHFSSSSQSSLPSMTSTSLPAMIAWVIRSSKVPLGPFNASSLRSNAFRLPDIVRSRRSDETCQKYYFDQNADLDGYGRELLKLAPLNTAHFEIQGADDVPLIPQNLRTQGAASLFDYLPMKEGPTWFNAKESGYAYYVELHSLAVLLATEARSTTASVDDRAFLRGAALINELYALHHLQDLYAPGHRQNDERALENSGLRRARHGCLNEHGATMTARDVRGLCSLASAETLPLLHARCPSADRPAFQPGQIFGDGGLVCSGNDEEAFALQFVAAVSLRSLLEVFSANSVDASAFAQVLAVTEMPSTIINGFASSSPGVRRFVTTDEAWQTHAFATVAENEPKAQLVQRLFAAGFFQALPPAVQNPPDGTCR